MPISLQPSFFPATLAGLVLYTIYRLLFVQPPPPDYFKLSGVPRPTPLWDFDIDKAKARPYRPFRWEYHQTTSLKKLDPDYWLELESTYRTRIAQRKALYAQRGTSILAALPGTHSACVELAEMVIQFLCARYPHHFHLTPSGVLHNHILGTHSPVPVRDSAADTGLDALKFIFEHVPEDFLVMQRDAATGLYMLRAGIACSALGWTLGEKLAQPLHEIHTPVPDYKEKMQCSSDRYFTKLACDKPIQRGAWGLEVGQPLFAPPGNGALRQAPTLAIEDVFLRVDWQILRRLPVSDAIVFNNKALFTPATALRDEPYIPRLLAKILRDMKTGGVEHCVLPKLDEWAREQEEKGWVPRDWKERTLDEDPFFPGWNDKAAHPC